MRIESKIQGGEYIGEVRTPHRHEDEMHVVSPSRFERDYRRVRSLEKVAQAAAQGLEVRMVFPSQSAPGLIGPHSITIDGLSVVDWAKSQSS